SPDGKQIAFLAGRARSAYTVEVVPAAGGRARIIGRNAYGAPSWSRDGRSLLYTDLIRRPFSTSVRVVNMVTHTNTRIDDNAGIARWSPDGATLASGRRPVPAVIGQDVWTVQPDGSHRRQLTGEFPTGLSFSDLDWTSGHVPPDKAVSPPDLLQLQATSELKLDSLDDLGRAGTPDNVVYRADRVCNADAETVSATLTVWTPSTGPIVPSTTPFHSWESPSSPT